MWAMQCYVELGVVKQWRSTVGQGKVQAGQRCLARSIVWATRCFVKPRAGRVSPRNTACWQSKAMRCADSAQQRGVKRGHCWVGHSLGNAGLSSAYQCVALAVRCSVSLWRGVVPQGYAVVQLSSAAPRVAPAKQRVAQPSPVEHRAAWLGRGTVELCVVPAEPG